MDVLARRGHGPRGQLEGNSRIESLGKNILGLAGTCYTGASGVRMLCITTSIEDRLRGSSSCGESAQSSVVPSRLELFDSKNVSGRLYLILLSLTIREFKVSCKPSNLQTTSSGFPARAYHAFLFVTLLLSCYTASQCHTYYFVLCALFEVPPTYAHPSMFTSPSFVPHSLSRNPHAYTLIPCPLQMSLVSSVPPSMLHISSTI